VFTTFPVDPTTLPATRLFPNKQPEPFNKPNLPEDKVDNTNTTENGYSKQAYFFNYKRDSLVTVGPSLPKITKLKNGGAQFWVGSIGVVAQGTGEYEGARGVSVYIGSGYLPKWPDELDAQIKILRDGFDALVGTYFKLVLKRDQA
jgi:hypothetical protein